MTNSTLPIRKVHLIFKTHLDVGYTDFAQNVVQHYFHHFIPQALELARLTRLEGRGERFIWTTGSWLIYEYLEKSDPAARQRMEEAIQVGDITWHGLPYTSYSEMMDASLYRHGLSLAKRLDERFGKQTIAAKMTDVPGHTRAIVPLLAEAGIQFLHIGVNAASCPPDVPPVCLWRDPSDAEVILMYHKGSYGDLMTLPGLDEAIQFAFTNDNEGPQSPEYVSEIFHLTRQRFPQAEVVGSTLDAFAAALARIKPSLPVVTGEIGNSWIHGLGTDPGKVARFRQLQRLRSQWLSQGRCKTDDPPVFALSQGLLNVAEHTWGMDIKVHLGDFETYETKAFRLARSQPNYQKVEASWAEQRAYLDDAVQALQGSSLGIEAQAALRDLEPQVPDLRGYEQVFDFEEVLDTAHFSVLFSEQGAITGLQNRTNGLRWASSQHLLGLFSYQAYSQANYDRFYRLYNQNKRQTRAWAIPDFTKPGMGAFGPEHRQEWNPAMQALWHRQDNLGDTFLAEMTCPDEPVHLYGCPQRLVCEFFFPKAQEELHITLQWFQKGACRFPEALWFSFTPKVNSPADWRIEKLGQMISPLNVVRNSNRRLHAVDRGVFYNDGRTSLSIASLDAALVAPGERSLLDFRQKQPDLAQGMHFNLYNNIWGTNHPMWYGEDARFRFVIRFD
jgi:hypothetical protein